MLEDLIVESNNEELNMALRCAISDMELSMSDIEFGIMMDITE